MYTCIIHPSGILIITYTWNDHFSARKMHAARRQPKEYFLCQNERSQKVHVRISKRFQWTLQSKIKFHTCIVYLLIILISIIFIIWNIQFQSKEHILIIVDLELNSIKGCILFKSDFSPQI